MIAFSLVGNTSAVRRLSVWFTYKKFKQMSVKDNAGNVLPHLFYRNSASSPQSLSKNIVQSVMEF